MLEAVAKTHFGFDGGYQRVVESVLEPKPLDAHIR